MGYQNSHRNFVMFYWLITLSGFCVKVLNLPWLNHPSSWIHPLRSLSRVAEQYLLEISEDVEKWGCNAKLEVTIPNPTYLYYLVLSCTWMYLVHSCEKESLVIIPHGASFLGLYSCRRICSKFYETWLNPGISFHPPS